MIWRFSSDSKGICFFCGKILSKSKMTRHIEKCIKKHITKSELPVYHVIVEGREYPDYWIHLEIKSDTTFGILDAFLRKLWLECCGHQSGFWEEGEFSEYKIRKTQKIGEIFEQTKKIYYVYDFGSSTSLIIRVISKYKSNFNGYLRLVARNLPPELKCKCGKKAVWVCAECFMEDPYNALLCDEHAKTHSCDKEALLPVVNSPRMGYCAYEGSALTDIFELYEYTDSEVYEDIEYDEYW